MPKAVSRLHGASRIPKKRDLVTEAENISRLPERRDSEGYTPVGLWPKEFLHYILYTTINDQSIVVNADDMHMCDAY